MADSSRRSTRFSARSKLLGQLLLENGDVRAEQMAQALKTQEQRGGLVGQILQRMDACSEQAIAAALLKQVQVTDVRCEELRVLPSVAELVPRELCEAERLCPFERLGGLLCLVMGNPLNRKAILQIEERARLKVKSFKSPWPRIQELIQRAYGGGGRAPAPPPVRVTVAGAEVGGEEMPGAGQLDIPPALEEPQPQAGTAAAAPPEEGAPAAEALPLPGEGQPVAESLPDVGTAVAEAPPEEGAAAAEEPQPEPEPQPEVAQEPEQWEEPAAGIVPVTESLLSTSVAPALREHGPPPKITGLEELDESHAEMIETTTRGLKLRRANAPGEEAPQVEPRARINVDLDKLDFSAAGAVAVEGRVAEAMAEKESSPSRAAAPGMAQLTSVPDSYFFADGEAPAEVRSEELLDLIGALPIAETVAQSMAEYEAQSAAKAAPAGPEPQPATSAAKPLELQSAPAAPVAAVPLSEVDFNQAVVALSEDPVGEWDWQYAAAGPLEVEEYEEH